MPITRCRDVPRVFGEAVLVEDRKSGVKLVIKHIPLESFEDHEVDGALNEVRALRLLQHPNVVRFHDSWVSNGVRQWVRSDKADISLSFLQAATEPLVGSIPRSLNILTEYADGGTIDRLLLRNTAPFDEMLISLWFAQLVLAVAHIHEQGILHRDIKVKVVPRPSV